MCSNRFDLFLFNIPPVEDCTNREILIITKFIVNPRCIYGRFNTRNNRLNLNSF